MSHFIPRVASKKLRSVWLIQYHKEQVMTVSIKSDTGKKILVCMSRVALKKEFLIGMSELNWKEKKSFQPLSYQRTHTPIPTSQKSVTPGISNSLRLITESIELLLRDESNLRKMNINGFQV